MVLISHRIRLHQSLILFFLFLSCSRNDTTSTISIRWRGDQAIGIEVPRQYLSQVPNDSIGDYLKVHLIDEAGRPAILGNYALTDNIVLFEPLIPMTHGLSYDVRVAGESVATIDIPLLERNGAPELLEIYPTQDTLPQNLLKFYFQFSDPMQEGHALENTVLLRDGRDTVSSVFLDLNPELWNYDGTILTLWLDPGRIKRDLQPNMLLGVPLEQHTNYRLIVGPAWRDARGESLGHEYVKDFYVTLRDSLSPDLKKWKVQEPRAGTREPLMINFNESLDAVLLWEVIQILGPNGSLIQGEFALEAEESRYIFTPGKLWASGNYMLQCESKVEDLAGNNLNRPFDRDVVRDSVIATQEAYTRQFRVK